jgi:hypothetical protein
VTATKETKVQTHTTRRGTARRTKPVTNQPASPDLSLAPIDVGFDPRRHPEMVCAIPVTAREVAYERDGAVRIATGSTAAILATLRAAGYRVRRIVESRSR